MRKLLFLSVIICLMLGGCKKPKPSYSFPIDFFKEKVTISVESTSVFVKGLYWFRNVSPESLLVPIFYPFPIDSTHLYPDFIYPAQEKELSFVKCDSGIYFTVVIGPKSEILFEVSYRQEIREPSACYIITTLQKWKKPIEKADFIVIVPKDFEKVNLSYPPDSVKEENNKRHYFITKLNFMPEKNILIHW